jgi:phosphatidylserine/phosphatidylglycerophosphate/cardiolipin synthase-like enzyme
MSRRRLERKRTTATVLKYIQGAVQSLNFENWVYMPVFHLSEAFAAARARHVQIHGFTNRDIEDGPAFFREAMDYAIKTCSERDSVGSEQVLQVSSQGGLTDAYELTPPKAPFYVHGKVMVRDSRDVLVGSFNLDSRSYEINLESAVTAKDCPELVADVQAGSAQLSQIYDDDLAGQRVPPKKEASLMAKVFARLSLLFL